MPGCAQWDNPSLRVHTRLVRSAWWAAFRATTSTRTAASSMRRNSADEVRQVAAMERQLRPALNAPCGPGGHGRSGRAVASRGRGRGAAPRAAGSGGGARILVREGPLPEESAPGSELSVGQVEAVGELKREAHRLERDGRLDYRARRGAVHHAQRGSAALATALNSCTRAMKWRSSSFGTARSETSAVMGPKLNVGRPAPCDPLPGARDSPLEARPSVRCEPRSPASWAGGAPGSLDACARLVIILWDSQLLGRGGREQDSRRLQRHLGARGLSELAAHLLALLLHAGQRFLRGERPEESAPGSCPEDVWPDRGHLWWPAERARPR